MQTYTLTILTKDGTRSVKYLDPRDAFDAAYYMLGRDACRVTVHDDSTGWLRLSAYADPRLASRSSLEAAERAWARGDGQ